MSKEPFYSIMPLVTDLYDLTLDEDQFETLGMIAWNRIGNKDQILRIVTLNPQPAVEGGWYVDKPCDLDEIEAITLPYEDCVTTSNVLEHPEVYSAPIENWIEQGKVDRNALYIPGKFVKYTELADKIMFTEPYRELNMLYKSHIFDSEGLPYVNENEKEAIAAFIAFWYYYKEGLKTKNTGTVNLAYSLKKEWLKLCDRAKTPESLSQNDMQEILDTMYSYDRHMYGKTSKILN